MGASCGDRTRDLPLRRLEICPIGQQAENTGKVSRILAKSKPKFAPVGPEGSPQGWFLCFGRASSRTGRRRAAPFAIPAGGAESYGWRADSRGRRRLGPPLDDDWTARSPSDGGRGRRRRRRRGAPSGRFPRGGRPGGGRCRRRRAGTRGFGGRYEDLVDLRDLPRPHRALPGAQDRVDFVEEEHRAVARGALEGRADAMFRLAEEGFRRLWSSLGNEIDPDEDALVCYPLCRSCESRILLAGKAVRSVRPAVIVA